MPCISYTGTMLLVLVRVRMLLRLFECLVIFLSRRRICFISVQKPCTCRPRSRVMHSIRAYVHTCTRAL